MYDFDSGALCLDFANTVDWHDSNHPHDWINDYSDLVKWAVNAGILKDSRLDDLISLARKNRILRANGYCSRSKSLN